MVRRNRPMLRISRECVNIQKIQLLGWHNVRVKKRGCQVSFIPVEIIMFLGYEIHFLFEKE